MIESRIDPIYRAKNDTLELNADYNVTPALTFTSQTGYNQDFLWSTEDYNRFNTAEGLCYRIRGLDGIIPHRPVFNAIWRAPIRALGIARAAPELRTLASGAYCDTRGLTVRRWYFLRSATGCAATGWSRRI